MAQWTVMMLELGPLLSHLENNIVQKVEGSCKGLVTARYCKKDRCKTKLGRNPMRIIC
jgi:hypothetical protein